MRVEIKKTDVMEEIYALSALQGYVSLPEREKALLQEDQAEGLAVLVADAFAEIVMELMPRVADCGMPGDNAGDMWIELKDGYGEDVMMPAVAAVIAKSMACMVLSAIYEECGGGDTYARRARRGIAIARETIDSHGGELPRLRGWR